MYMQITSNGHCVWLTVTMDQQKSAFGMVAICISIKMEIHGSPLEWCQQLAQHDVGERLTAELPHTNIFIFTFLEPASRDQ